MDYFPLFARIRNQRCLVVGGGEVALRKARELARAGARVTVLSPECQPELADLARQGTVAWQPGRFDGQDLQAYWLVIAATDDGPTNHAVASAAAAAHRYCNVVDDAVASSFIMPGIVERSPLILAVSSGGHSPVLARLLRQRIERWLPENIGALAVWAGRWRERARQLLPDISRRRAFLERLLTGEAAACFLAGDAGRAESGAERLLSDDAAAPAAGHAWLVGAGPGDPGLISLRGLQALEQADVVLHDRLVDPALLRSARREAEIIAVGKTGGGPSTPQADINRLLLEQVRAGRRVCRLKGGDPFIFGRGGEEAQALAAAGLSYEIIPGITAASGCAAAAGIPLTHRGLATAVTLVTAQGAAGSTPDWVALARPGHTLAIYMGGRQVAAIATELLRAGARSDAGVAVISGGTSRQQDIVTGTLADIGVRFKARPGLPTLMIVGDTVQIAAELAAGCRDTAPVSSATAPAAQPLPVQPAAFPGA